MGPSSSINSMASTPWPCGIFVRRGFCWLVTAWVSDLFFTSRRVAVWSLDLRSKPFWQTVASREPLTSKPCRTSSPAGAPLVPSAHLRAWGNSCPDTMPCSPVKGCVYVATGNRPFPSNKLVSARWPSGAKSWTNSSTMRPALDFVRMFPWEPTWAAG